MDRSEAGGATESAGIFPASYEASRARFRRSLGRVAAYWPEARLEHHRLDGDEDLTIDWIWADARDTRDKCLVLTGGIHGVEADVGSAMQQLFLDVILPQLAVRSTGLLLVHCINPWGMAHRRRTNSHNVDLNRNFGGFDPASNADYDRLDLFLNPRRPVPRPGLSDLLFFFGLLRAVASLGMSRFHRAVLLGQYRFPRGLYYGGTSPEPETEVLMGLYRRAIEPYNHLVCLDLHTGYGPRYQMSVVNSPRETRSTESLSEAFLYPRVVQAASDFYAMQGDMIDWVYGVCQDQGKRVYGAALEFGTVGESLLALVHSLRVTLLENQTYWHGAAGERARQRAAREIEAMHAPREERWRDKALADARRALDGILRAEGFLSG